MYRLMFKNGAFPGKTLTVKQDRLVAGSGTDAHLRVPDTAVGAIHAVFTEDNRGVHVRAVSRDRLIHINGQPTQTHTLAHGDEIGLGQTNIRYESLRAGHPATSKRTVQQMEKVALRLVGAVLVAECLLAAALTFHARPDLLQQILRRAPAPAPAATDTPAPETTPTPPAYSRTREAVSTPDVRPVTAPAPAPDIHRPTPVATPVTTRTPVVVPEPEPRPAAEPAAEAATPDEIDPILARARELMKEAEQARLRSDYKTADRLYERVEILAPSYAPAYAAWAELLESRGLLTEAGEQWTELMRNSTGSWQRKATEERTRLARMNAAPKDQVSDRIGRRREQIETRGQGAIRVAGLNVEQQSPGAGIEEMYVATLRLSLNPNRVWVPADAVVISALFFDRDTLTEELSVTQATVPRSVMRLNGIWRKDEEKSLTATCLVPKDYRAGEKPGDPPVSEYGGLLIRVYFEGELQDSAANPPELAALASQLPIPEEVNQR